tara:strand:- start:1943 stop:2431 length:489 start_codon:yes stop_codon:yes gene_type:complete
MIAAVEVGVMMEELITWMHSEFDGDLTALSHRAAEYAESQGWIGGELWHEAGAVMLTFMFRQDIRRARAADSSRRAAGDVIDKVRDPSGDPVFMEWYRCENRWLQLGQMTKKDCEFVAEHRRKIAVANQKEAEFFEALAARLRGKDRIIDRYTPEQIEALRD